MNGIGQVVATGGTAIVGVAVGSGLTYWFGTLNRRHQEVREDRTRWYVERFKAYAELSRAMFDGALLAGEEDHTSGDHKRAAQALVSAVGTIRLVGSPEAVVAAERLLGATTAWMSNNEDDPKAEGLRATLGVFEAAARKDLGQHYVRFLEPG